MDFRIQETVEKMLEHLNIQKSTYDRVSFAGGAADKENLKKHLELSQRLHQSSHAILTIHEDCGAGAQKEDLLTAQQITDTLGFTSQLFIIKLDGTWEEITS
jgi:cyanophycinase-like exopeptidase